MKNKRHNISHVKKRIVKYIGVIEYVYPDYFTVRLTPCSGDRDEFFIDFENGIVKKNERHKIEEGQIVEIVSYNDGKQKFRFKEDEYWTQEEIEEFKRQASEISGWIKEYQKDVDK